MAKIHLLLALLISMLLASCNKDTGSIIIYDIQDEFNIEIFQENNNANNFFLKITTLDEYPSNYRIEADLVNVNNKIELNIYRILKPTNPTNQTKYLSKNLNLENLEIGNYNLDLILRNTIVNEGAVSIKPETIELDFSTKHGISSKHYEVNRIASNGYWGVAYVESEDHSPFLDNFMQKIKDVSIELTNPRQGNYGYFSIDNHNKVNLALSPHGVYQNFYMTSDELDTINDFVQEYKSFGVGFHAVIYTAQGQIFHHTSYDSAIVLEQYLIN